MSEYTMSDFMKEQQSSSDDENMFIARLSASIRVAVEEGVSKALDADHQRRIDEATLNDGQKAAMRYNATGQVANGAKY